MSDKDNPVQDALHAAVSRMNGNGTPPPGGAPAADPMALLMTILPKLLEARDERDELKGEGFEDIRKQVRGSRKQTQRMHKDVSDALETISRDMHEMREQLTAVGNAVLQLAEHMERIEVVADYDDDDDYEVYQPEELDDLQASPSPRVTQIESQGRKRSRQKSKKNRRPRP